MLKQKGASMTDEDLDEGDWGGTATWVAPEDTTFVTHCAI